MTESGHASNWNEEVVVPGPIAWGDYTVPCDRCGPAESWTLHVQNTYFGLDAWLTCPNGHDVWNPVIYPDIVLKLLRAPDVTEALARMPRDLKTGWYPRIRVDPATIPATTPEGNDIAPSQWGLFALAAATRTPYFAEKFPDLQSVLARTED